MEKRKGKAPFLLSALPILRAQFFRLSPASLWHHRGQTSKSLFSFFIAGISFTS